MSPAKRLFDLFWSVFGLGLLWPLFAAIALAIKLDDGGPVYFRQERIGRGGKPFRMWKFRTMVVDAERRGMPLTVGRDPRVTRLGHWLRQTKVDELPQLFNVIAGEMSLVGPRPEVPRYTRLYSPEQQQVLALAPGITDPASIRFRHENEILAKAVDAEKSYIEAVMPEKIRLNLDYADGANVVRDLGVIVGTLVQLFR